MHQMIWHPATLIANFVTFHWSLLPLAWRRKKQHNQRQEIHFDKGARPKRSTQRSSDILLSHVRDVIKNSYIVWSGQANRKKGEWGSILTVGLSIRFTFFDDSFPKYHLEI